MPVLDMPAPGLVGTGTLANGSRIGEAGCTYLPWGPQETVNGEGLGPPKSPKSAPVQPLVQVQVPGSPGPACERSTRFEPPETLCVVGSDEFTWMLRLGPPQILIVMFPFPLNVLGL